MKVNKPSFELSDRIGQLFENYHYVQIFGTTQLGSVVDPSIIVDLPTYKIHKILNDAGYAYTPIIRQDSGCTQVVGLPNAPWAIDSYFCIWSSIDLDPYVLGANLRLAVIEGVAKEFIEHLRMGHALGRLLPEFQASLITPGGKYHHETVYEHLLDTFQAAQERTKSESVRWAALLHDIGKPTSWKEEPSPDGCQAVKHTFHGHEVFGERIARDIMTRLGISNDIIQHATRLIRMHMFMFPEEATDNTVRRWLYNAGKRQWRQLIELRTYDRMGNHATRHKPAYTAQLRKLENRCERLIASKKVTFREDLNVSQNLESWFPGRSQDEVDGMYLQLIDIVNKDPSKNTVGYLEEYVRRVYAYHPSHITMQAVRNEDRQTG